MKVSDVRTAKTSRVKKRSATRRAASSGEETVGFADHLSEVAGGAGPAAGAGAAAAVAGVGAVLAAQEVGADNAGEARRQGVRHGEDILDKLDEIRMDLLAGAIPRDRLANLAALLRAKRAQADDPRLIQILKEIELRAEVEIAKYTRTL